MKRIFVFIIPLLLSALACSVNTANYATPTVAAQISLLPQGTPTMSMLDFSSTLLAQEQNNWLTKQASELAVQAEKAKADQASINATMQASKMNATSTAGVATAQAYNGMETAWAVGTATSYMQATQGAATTTAGVATAAQAPTSAIWTAEAVEREARIQEAEVQNVELARDRQNTKNFADAVLPWTLTVISLFLIGRGLFEYLKNRIVTRDEHGKMPTVMRQLPDGSMAITRLDLLPSPTAVIKPNGEIIIQEASQDQSDVTRRVQITEAISALPIPYARNAPAMMKTEFGNGAGTPSVKIINDARALSPVLEEAEATLAEE